MRSFKVSIVLSFVLSFFLAPVGTAHAEEPQAEGRKTALYVAQAVVLPISPKGVGLPPALVESFAIALPIGERFSLIPEVGMATAMTVFQPSPRLQLGFNARLTNSFYLGLTGVYGYVPHWDGTPSDAHLVGGFIAPAFALTKEIFLVLPIGVVGNVTAKAVSVPLAVKFAFKLPI